MITAIAKRFSFGNISQSNLLITGLIGVLVNSGIFYLAFQKIHLHYLAASALSFGLVLILGFVFNKFTLQIKKEHNTFRVLAVLLVGVLFVVVNSCFVFTFVSINNANIFSSHLLVSAFFIVCLLFVSNRRSTFLNSIGEDIAVISVSKNTLRILFVAIAVSLAMIFFRAGIHDMRVDGQLYADQINSFRDGSVFADPSPGVLLRIFKPLYGIIGTIFTGVLTPENLIVIVNIFFFFLLSASSYVLFCLLGFSEKLTRTGVLWMLFAYPVMKYGLAVSTDISGWFFLTSSIASVLIFERTRNSQYLLLGSILTCLGILSKETGALCLVFFTLYLLYEIQRSSWKETFKTASMYYLPIIIFIGFFTVSLASKAPSFLDWYAVNVTHYNKDYWTLAHFFRVEAAAFNFLWIYILAFFASCLCTVRPDIKDKKTNLKLYLPMLCVSTLPVLLWPIFISRIIFIQFIFLIPLALLGMKVISAQLEKVPGAEKYHFDTILAFSPVLLSVSLYLASDGGNLLRFFQN